MKNESIMDYYSGIMDVDFWLASLGGYSGNYFVWIIDSFWASILIEE